MNVVTWIKVNTKLFICLFFLFLFGCANNKESIEVTLPYAAGCKDTLLKVERIFSQLNSIKLGSNHSVEYKFFDVKSMSNDEIQGIVSLKYLGPVEPLEGSMSPHNYLISVANGIQAECMQDSRVNLGLPIEPYHLEDILKGKNKPVVKIIGNEIVIFYNSGDYQLSE